MTIASRRLIPSLLLAAACAVLTASSCSSEPKGSTPTSSATGTLVLSASSYSVAQGAGAVTIVVQRTMVTDGTASVTYATVNGTARAGTHYTAASGTLNWPAGDTSPKSFNVLVSANPTYVGNRTFNVQLSSAMGATLGAPSGATVSVAGSATPSTALTIRVEGSKLVDGQGNTVQLRGANVAGLEYVATQGWSPQDPWGGQNPDFQALKSWKLNAVRFPLNEASWLGLTTYDWPAAGATAGKPRQADPGGNYRQTVISTVNAAVAAGLYVILDMHISAPDAVLPGTSGKVPATASVQNQMADADHARAFWSSVADTFKDNPAVIFDLFNEPHIDGFRDVAGFRDASAWKVLRDGGTAINFLTTNGSEVTVTQNWQTAGMQSMLNAVRTTGATNVVMSAGISWAQDTSMWVAYAPVDPLRQLACAWHGYPQGPSGTAGTVPGFGPDNYVWAEAILAAGYPVIIGETGDLSSNGTVSAPFMAKLLPWADLHGVSVIGWGWNAWGGATSDLIKDKAGTPTDGYGQAFRSWSVNHP